MYNQLCALFLLLTAAAPTSAQVLFYGGDFDGRTEITSEQNTLMPGGTMTYDDFTLSSKSTIDSLWGNFVISGDHIPTTAYYEIRSGMSSGNGGVLAQYGTINLLATTTGRLAGNLDEYQLLGAVNFQLNAGTYWIGIAPIGNGTGQYFVNTASGTDLGPNTDPNPTPTGETLANGMALLYIEVTWGVFDFLTLNSILGEGTYDISYGLGGVAVPEPATFTLGATTIGLLLYRKRRQQASF